MRKSTLLKIAGGILFATAVFFLFAPGGYFPRMAAQQKSATERLMAEKARKLDERKAATLARQRAAVVKFEKQADQILNAAYRKEEWRIHVAVEDLTGWKASAYLSYLLAYDGLRGKSTAGTFIGQTASPVFAAPVAESSQLLERAFAGMATEMAVAGNEYSAACLQEMNSLPEGAGTIDTSGITLGNLPVEEINKAATLTIQSPAFLAVDAVFLPQLLVSMETVLAVVVGRITTTLVASGTLAVVDGPLPIGDAIAVVVGVGGSAWSAYELYKARCKLVPLVRSKLTAQYQAQKDSFRKSAVAQAYQLLEKYENQLAPRMASQNR